MSVSSAQRGLRWVFVAAVCAVLVGTVLSAASPIGSAPFNVGRLTTVVAGAVLLATGVARMVLDREDRSPPSWLGIGFAVLAAFTGWIIQGPAAAAALDRQATERVTAYATKCTYSTVSWSWTCTYHWTVGGRSYSSLDNGSNWTDGHQVTIKVVPGDPGRAEISQKMSSSVGVTVFMAVMTGLMAAVPGLMWFLYDVIPDSDGEVTTVGHESAGAGQAGGRSGPDA